MYPHGVPHVWWWLSLGPDRSPSPAYIARLSRLLRLTSIASTEYSRPLASIGVVGVMQREAVAHGKDARKL